MIFAFPPALLLAALPCLMRCPIRRPLQETAAPIFAPARESSRNLSWVLEQELVTRRGELRGNMWGYDTSGNESLERRVRVLDRYRETAPRRPLVLERTFEELEQEAKLERAGPSYLGRLPQMTSRLEGASVLFEWSAEDEGYEVGWAGPEANPAWLEGLEEDMSLRVLLPVPESSVGARWAIDPRSLPRLLAPGGRLWPEPAELGENDHPLPPVTAPCALDQFEGTILAPRACPSETRGHSVCGRCGS